MASSIGILTRLEEPDYVEMWLKSFAAHARSKKLQDKKNIGGENEITDLFLASARCEANMRVAVMLYPKDLEDLTFEEIAHIIRNNLRPKKKSVIVERTKFLSMKQNPNETARNYIQRLKKASRFCEFEKLGKADMTIEEELI